MKHGDWVCLWCGRAAAFRRLCVETLAAIGDARSYAAAAFRRLCVETFSVNTTGKIFSAAAFRRLCVETKKP